MGISAAIVAVIVAILWGVPMLYIELRGPVSDWFAATPDNGDIAAMLTVAYLALRDRR